MRPSGNLLHMRIAGRSIGGSVHAMVMAVFCLLLFACSSMPPLNNATEAESRLASGDKIRVQVYEHPEFSGDFVLAADGSISVPTAGAVSLAGKSLRQAETEVAQKLKQELNKPQVSINMLEYRPIYVLGQVTQPGQYPFMSGMKVLNAIALARGYTYRADPSRITVIRGDDANARPMKATEADSLQPGDTIKVLESWF
ncbi:MAG TPA: polysaccharide biosynthesis/export family protein [Terriglobia bacterium]|nr:polysaccharide biosynthesis/export family protein [Terriglobia bacterium]